MSPMAVPSGRTVCQSALAPGSSFPLSCRPVNVPPVWGDDASVPLADIAYVERLAKRGFQPVDVGQPRLRKLIIERPAPDRREAGDRDVHPGRRATEPDADCSAPFRARGGRG